MKESRQALSRNGEDLMKNRLQQIPQTEEGQEQEGTDTTPILYRWGQGVIEEQMSRHQGVPWNNGTRTVSSDTKGCTRQALLTYTVCTKLTKKLCLKTRIWGEGGEGQREPKN